MGGPWGLDEARFRQALREREVAAAELERQIEEIHREIAEHRRLQQEEQKRVRAEAERQWRAEQAAGEQLGYAQRGYAHVSVNGAQIGSQAQDASEANHNEVEELQRSNGGTSKEVHRTR